MAIDFLNEALADVAPKTPDKYAVQKKVKGSDWKTVHAADTEAEAMHWVESMKATEAAHGRKQAQFKIAKQPGKSERFQSPEIEKLLNEIDDYRVSTPLDKVRDELGEKLKVSGKTNNGYLTKYKGHSLEVTDPKRTSTNRPYTIMVTCTGEKGEKRSYVIWYDASPPNKVRWMREGEPTRYDWIDADTFLNSLASDE